MSIYAADNSFRVSVVNGSTRTGLYAANGSFNVVQVDGTTRTGLYHKCGAYNVVKVATDPKSSRHPCGAYPISPSPYVKGAMKVTVVAGALT